jgi:predicted amidohydrolase YtcJ
MENVKQLTKALADVILTNANVITMNKQKPQAQALAIKEGKIIQVDSNDEAQALTGKDTKIIDLRGKTIIPGLIDAHAHMLALAPTERWIELRDVASIKEIQQKLKAKAQETKKGRWILGRGWDQDRLKEKRYPTRWDMDKVSPENPVLLKRVCGHIAVANTRALKTAKIDKAKAASLGELIDKDPRTGEPTGILRENAMDTVSSMTEPRDEDVTTACKQACHVAVKAGLTSVHWLVSKPNEVQALQQLEKKNQLPIRVNLIIPVEHLHTFKTRKIQTHFLKLNCAKIFVDGSLGARTAALEQPYTDDPSTKGVLYYSLDQLKALIKTVNDADFQAAVHVIGDQAVNEALEAFKETVGKSAISKRRHRLEHVSVLNPRVIKQIRELGLTVCIQPHFVVSDFWVPQRLGPERARWTYPFKSLIESGIPVAGSSDTPAEPLNPILGIWAAVARESFPEERITIQEALEAYTVNAAYFSFEEKVKGSIEVGKFADFTVLSQDPLTARPERIRDIKVEMTVVGGKIVYSVASLGV